MRFTVDDKHVIKWMWVKNYLEKVQIIFLSFYAVRISIQLTILSEIFIPIGFFSKSYAKKQKWMFFLNTV